MKNRVIEALKSGQKSIPEIAIAVGVSQPTVKRAVDELHLENIVRIADWLPVGRNPRRAAFYAIGSEPDAVYPLRTPEQKRAGILAYRKRYNEKRRLNREAPKKPEQPIFRHPHDVAFFGEPSHIRSDAGRIEDRVFVAQDMTITQDELEEA